MRIRPSNLERTLACPGSPKLIAVVEEYTDKPSPYAAEGNAAHQLAESLLHGVVKPEDLEGARVYPRDEKDKEYGEGYEFADLYNPGVKDYVEHIRQIRETKVLRSKRINPWFGAELRIEYPIDVPFLPGKPGKADAVLLSPGKKSVWVIDYKHGQGVTTDARVQGIAYLIGLRDEFPEAEHFYFQVFQPRLHWTNKTQTVPVYYSRNRLVDLEREYRRKLAEEHKPLRIGPHCTDLFCPAKIVCPLVMGLIDEITEASEGGTLEQFIKDNVVRIIKSAKVLEAAIKSAVQVAADMYAAGELPEGLKVVEKRKRPAEWNDTVQALATLSNLLGENVYKKPELITPAQAKKALDKEHWERIDELSHRPQAGTSIAPADDKRPETKPKSNFEE